MDLLDARINLRWARGIRLETNTSIPVMPALVYKNCCIKSHMQTFAE